MYIPAPQYSIIVIGHVVYSTYCTSESPAAVERGSPLSVGERTSPAPVPSAVVPQKLEPGSCKPELGFTMRLGAQVHRSPQRNFSSHLASG
ncbi:unnamed protein product [Staurois parvus]|uniref:Uncharacterized protein n=1 Tax=Staurois parvus TaxID=386267 RepID=A0ABN9BU33_9NEOB|nr:unnamed protein product [Staurois parvus]